MTYVRRGPSLDLELQGLGLFGVPFGWDIQGLKDALASGSQATYQRCWTVAQKATAELTARRELMMRNWKVKSFYLTTDMAKLIESTVSVLGEAAKRLNEYWFTFSPQVSQPYKDAIQQELTQLRARMAEGTQKYLPAVVTADKNKVRIIDSPGFKNWVERSLIEVEVAYEFMAKTECEKPWWVGVWEGAKRVLGALEYIVNLIKEALLKLGETIMKIPDTLDTLWTITKWGTLIGGGAYLLWKLKQARDKRGG